MVAARCVASGVQRQRSGGASGAWARRLSGQSGTGAGAAGAVRFRRNGIEFRSQTAFAPWTEMTVEWETAARAGKFHSTGVVVKCERREGQGRGYQVAVLFTRLSRQAQAHLHSLADSSLVCRPPAM